MIALALRSLRFYWRTHLGVVFGATCATAVLVGALAVGDSVRLSLRAQAENRIGGFDAVLAAGDRKFTSSLADRIAKDLTGHCVAPVLTMPGIARDPGGASRAGIVDVYGVDGRFFAASPGGARPAPESGRCFLNARAARQLGVGAGATILLRIEKPSVLPRDTLMATVDDISFALRVEVAAVVSDAEFGRFGLRASQVPPFNVFVSLTWLQERLDLEDRANLLLVGGPGSDPASSAERADAAIQKHWTIADAELRVRRAGALDELTSRRVFIDPPVVRAVTGTRATDLVGISTYFVNRVAKGERTTPYSTVAAIGPLTATPPSHPAVRALLRLAPAADTGMVVNRWLADDLGAAADDELTIDYLVMGARLKLENATARFAIERIAPLAGAAADPSLMPEFPGLADSANCRDWEPGIPIDLDAIRDKDEKYWDGHRGTPKAFLTLARGRRLFGNRYGELTAIRGPRGFAASVAAELPRRLAPRDLGLFFQDIRTPALASGTSATDFGGLFLGLSFFLIGAALLLASLLFVFGVEQRANEIGTLLAVGFRARQVRRLFLLESTVLALAGGVLGAALGMGYTRAVLYGLATLWRDAVGTTTLAFHAPFATVAMGAVIAVFVAVASIAVALRRIFDRPAIELLNSKNGIPGAADSRPRHGRLSLWLAAGCPVLAVGLGVFAGTSSTQVAGAFFGAGALLLVGALALCRRLLARFAGSTGDAPIDTVGDLGVRNAGRRPGRSLATIALLGSGTFLVAAVQANRLEPPRDTTDRSSGTGGFALFGRSTLPVLRDLGSTAGREEFDLTAEELAGVDIVPMRVRDGDDASCLNLSLAQNPRLVGVRPDLLARREAFAFSGTQPPEGAALPGSPWQLLDADYGAGVVPAIGDAASITWALHKSLGDDLEYTDERGQRFRVRLVGAVANSILQGNLVVAERHLRARFPSATGYRMFLIDAPEEGIPAVAKRLTGAFEDLGMELTTTAGRLRDFNAVQNTYLLIFQVLGGLGLLLGSLGVGMVVLRNALERRSELALLAAVGLTARGVRKLVWSEHALLLLMGLGCGAGSALLAVLPTAEHVSLLPTALLVLAVGVSGALWVMLASRLATRGPLLAALQDE